jgi:hypothetical protein
MLTSLPLARVGATPTVTTKAEVMARTRYIHRCAAFCGVRLPSSALAQFRAFVVE